MLRHCFHGGFEIFVGRIDEKPLSQNLMRRQRRELGLNGGVMFEVSADQNPVPVPAAGFRWLNQQQHLTLEQVHGKPTEHSLGKEGPVLNKRLKNPLVFELLRHVQPVVPTLAESAESLHVLEGLLILRTDLVDQFYVDNDALF